jgi:hypothetical protein
MHFSQLFLVIGLNKYIQFTLENFHLPNPSTKVRLPFIHTLDVCRMYRGVQKKQTGHCLISCNVKLSLFHSEMTNLDFDIYATCNMQHDITCNIERDTTKIKIFII